MAVLGALARTLVPYLETLRDNPETSFDRKFLVPPVVSCVIALVTLPLALSALPKELMESATLSASGLVAVFFGRVGRDGCGAFRAKSLERDVHPRQQGKGVRAGRVRLAPGAGRHRGHCDPGRLRLGDRRRFLEHR